MKLCCQSALISLFVLVLAGCAATVGTSPRGLEIPIERAAIKFLTDLQAGGYRIVSTDELKKWLDEKRDVIFVSTLPAAEERELGVIQGSHNAEQPEHEKDLAPEDREHLLLAAGNNKQRTLIVYCGYVASRRSHIGAKFLVDNGYKNVYRYPAGVTGWTEAGFPLAK